MKRKTGFILFLLLLALCAYALADVEIDENSFPDDSFRGWVKENCDQDGDGSLSDDEIAAVITIDVAEKGITSIKGIEHFTALMELRCNNNQLTELDVSANTALAVLYCYDNQLTGLDVSRNTVLDVLSCYDNQLTELDLSRNTTLTWLQCEFNQLTGLDVSANTALFCLSCDFNQLTKLDVSTSSELVQLTCGGNQLNKLDVSRNTALRGLSCYDNQLTRLDLRENTALEWLFCDGNQLTELDVSGNTALVWLWCHSNKIKKLDVSRIPALKDLTKNTKPAEEDGHLLWSAGDNGYGSPEKWLSVDKDVLIITGEPEKTDISKAKISAIKDQVYTGKAIKPAFTVKLGKKKLSAETDYKITWKNNKKIGTATVIVTGKGNYTGTVKATFKINPKPVTLSTVTAGSIKLIVEWKKSSGITGYEIQYGLKKNFKDAKTVTIKKAKTTSTEIKKLKKGKTYYVRIRDYKTVNGTKYYSTWSKVLKAKVK